MVEIEDTWLKMTIKLFVVVVTAIVGKFFIMESGYALFRVAAQKVAQAVLKPKVDNISFDIFRILG